MNTYIALLRGVNVGGKNKISMPLLKAACEKAGFSGVSTYINSGNVLFSSAKDARELQDITRRIIKKTFKLDIPVAVISAAVLKRTLKNAPSWWGADENSTHNIIFAIPPADIKEIIKKVGESKPEYELVSSYAQAVFWSAPLKTFSKTRWSKISANSVYGSVTVRNARTAKTLLQLALRDAL